MRQGDLRREASAILSSFLRERRIALGLSLKELGEQVGFSELQMANFERFAGLYSSRVAIKVFSALGVLGRDEFEEVMALYSSYLKEHRLRDEHSRDMQFWMKSNIRPLRNPYPDRIKLASAARNFYLNLNSRTRSKSERRSDNVMFLRGEFKNIGDERGESK